MRITFNDVFYKLPEGKECLICPNRLPYMEIIVLGCSYSISYYSFLDRTSQPCLHFSSLSVFNSSINGEIIAYSHGIMSRGTIKSQITGNATYYSNLQWSINICLKYGLITLVDPLSEKKC